MYYYLLRNGFRLPYYIYGHFLDFCTGYPPLAYRSSLFSHLCGITFSRGGPILLIRPPRT